MIDSVGVGSVVVGDEAAAGLVELPVSQSFQLCQMPAARASRRWATRVVRPGMVCAPCCSRESWPLSVSRTDSIHWRMPPSFPKRGFSPLRSGRTKIAPSSAISASKSWPAKPLVRDHGVPLQLHAAQHLSGDLALGNVRGCQLERDRHPVGGAQQVEPEPPEIAGMAGAITIGGVPGELRALTVSLEADISSPTSRTRKKTRFIPVAAY
jgi:hypothetical protein